MRTTLTLDDDVAATLERLRKTRKATLKQLVNEALREGLKQIGAPKKRTRRVYTRSVDLGLPRVTNVDNIAEVLAVAEGEWFK